MPKTKKRTVLLDEGSLLSPAARDEAARRAVAFWTEDRPPSEPPPKTVREGGKRPKLEPTVICADAKLPKRS